MWRRGSGSVEIRPLAFFSGALLKKKLERPLHLSACVNMVPVAVAVAVATAVPVAVVVAVHVPVAVAVAVNVNVDVDVVVAVACVSFLAVAVGEKPQCVFCYAFIWSYRVPAAHCRHGALRNIEEAVNSQVCVCAVAECECVRT